jgi:hypothetical protein
MASQKTDEMIAVLAAVPDGMVFFDVIFLSSCFRIMYSRRKLFPPWALTGPSKEKASGKSGEFGLSRILEREATEGNSSPHSLSVRSVRRDLQVAIFYPAHKKGS